MHPCIPRLGKWRATWATLALLLLDLCVATHSSGVEFWVGPHWTAGPSSGAWTRFYQDTPSSSPERQRPGVSFTRYNQPNPRTNMTDFWFEWGYSQVPLWALGAGCLAVGVAPTVAAVIWRRYFRRRRPAHHCQRCGYDMTGLEQCPECGRLRGVEQR